MPDDVAGEQAEAEAVEQQQAAPEATPTTEGASQGGSTSVPSTPSWKVGDTAYTDPNEMHKAFLKWQGDFTRKSQDYSKREKEYTQKLQTYEKAFEIIKSDPSLTQLVRAKIQAGMSPQQAVQQTAQQAQIPPEVAQKLEYLESKEQEREENASLDAFEKSHKDLTDAEWDQMGDWIDSNDDALKTKGFTPGEILEYAYMKTVYQERQQKAALAAHAEKQKGEEVENGKKSAFLGSQAPTAGAKPAGLPERKRGMTPAEERAWATKVYHASKPKK